MTEDQEREVERLTTERDEAYDCECDDDMTEDGHGAGCPNGVTFLRADNERLREALADATAIAQEFDRRNEKSKAELERVREERDRAVETLTAIAREAERFGRWDGEPLPEFLRRLGDSTLDMEDD